jgi:hypothetical protein
VWIAETDSAGPRLKLVGIRRVQELRGDPNPFTRLAQYLHREDFAAAAIDAPFSIPKEHLPSGGHRKLVEIVAKLPLSASRPFPSAIEFLRCLLEGKSPMPKKPLRRTEQYWNQKGVNVRSTLWAGARGGAAMTAACLKLLSETECPIWPWQRNQRQLLVEAFPAAQLRHWRLPHQAYNRQTARDSAVRRSIVKSLTARIDLGDFQNAVEQSADALDAVLCALAAQAVVDEQVVSHEERFMDTEGLIAVANS